MAVRAKFKVVDVQPINENDMGGHVQLSPVIGGSEENDEFYRYTPGGSISLSTINEKALAEFNVGDEFYIDFTKVQ